MTGRRAGAALRRLGRDEDALLLYAEVMGEVRLDITAMRNHWWNVPLHLSARAFTTGLRDGRQPLGRDATDPRSLG